MVLATNPYVAVLGDDLIILDLRQDQYFYLAGFLAGREVTAPEQLADCASFRHHLRDRQVQLAPTWAPVPPQLPAPLEEICGADPGAEALALGGRGARDVRCNLPWRAYAAISLAKTLEFHGRPLRALIASVERSRHTLRPPFVPFEASVTAFEAWSPYWPYQGQCLYRAFVRLKALHAHGHDARWVFGVRLWPFQAHCWLQAGERVIGDHAHRVGGFTPILVV